MRRLRPPTASDTRASLPGNSRQFRHKTRDFVRSRAQIRLLPQAATGAKYSAVAATSRNGETRTRTGDTTIFRQLHAGLERPRKSCKNAGSRSPGPYREVRELHAIVG